MAPGGRRLSFPRHDLLPSSNAVRGRGSNSGLADELVGQRTEVEGVLEPWVRARDADERRILELHPAGRAVAERIEHVGRFDQADIAKHDLAGHVRYDERLACLDRVVGEYGALDDPRAAFLEEGAARDC